MHVHCLKKPAIYRKFISKSVFKKTQLFLENSLRLVIAKTCFIYVILKISKYFIFKVLQNEIPLPVPHDWTIATSFVETS